MRQRDPLPVEIQRLLVLEEGFRRPCTERRRWLAACWCAQRLQHVLVRDDKRLRHDALDSALTNLSREIARDQLGSRGGHLEIAADKLRVSVSVDDVTDRTRAGERAYRGDESIGLRLRHRVDDEHAL